MNSNQHPNILQVDAWVNKMPGTVPSLSIVGTMWVGNPCQRPYLTKLPDDPNRPGLYRVKLDFNVEGFRCKQLRVTAEFRYREENYQGTHTGIEIEFDDGPSLTVPLDNAE